MVRQKHKQVSRIISAMLLLAAIVIWALWWLLSQALFIIDVPLVTNFLTRGRSATEAFVATTMCIIISTAVVSLMYFLVVHKYEFLKIKRWQLLLYAVPLILFVRAITLNEVFGIPGYVYAVGMAISAVAQDLVTFGYLQTYLETRIARLVAALTVGLVFFAAHFTYGLSFVTLFYFCGFLVFSLLRYKFKNIYMTNVLHVSFLLLV